MNEKDGSASVLSTSATDGPTLELTAQIDRGPWSLEIGSSIGCRIVPLAAGASLVLGSGRAADVCIDDRTVSARHARIEVTATGVFVEDLASRNGVLVGAARVPGAWLGGASSSFVVGRTTVTVRGLAQRPKAIPLAEPLPGLVGTSLPMRQLAADIRRYAELRAPVLLQGESGSGKDVVAQAIHALSGRPGQYLPINVAAIPESLADAELFGHKKGAFTGAIAARSGAFEEAHRGTLFLDEVAELAPSIQVKLLRVVEEHRVRPIGCMQAQDVDVRILSATWAPLEERVSSGRFREDLYHRISTFVIRLPPLRARKSDIPALARVILRRVREEIGPRELSSAALARLVAHGWPGNVRELGAVLYRAAVGADREEIQSDDIESALLSATKIRPRALSDSEANLLLAEHGGNVSAAARTAGVARSTFRSWIGKT